MRRYPNVQHYVPANLQELEDLLKKLVHNMPDFLFINGGDGTIHRILTLLWQYRLDIKFPILGLIRGGTTNLIAHELGIRRSLDRLLDKMMQFGLEHTTILSKPAMVIEHPSFAKPQIGFFFGTGAFARATDLSRQQLRAQKMRGILSILLPLVKSVYGAFKNQFGRKNNIKVDNFGLYQGYRGVIQLDQHMIKEQDYLLFLATTLNKLPLGLKVFWGQEQSAIRYLSVSYPPYQFFKAIPLLLLGRPSSWMIDHGYCSGTASNLGINFNSTAFLDGEDMPDSMDQPLRFATTPKFNFIVC